MKLTLTIQELQQLTTDRSQYVRTVEDLELAQSKLESAERIKDSLFADFEKIARAVGYTTGEGQFAIGGSVNGLIRHINDNLQADEEFTKSPECPPALKTWFASTVDLGTSRRKKTRK